MLLVTGGAGFIGANFVLSTIAATGEPIVNLDKLTYAGNPGNLASLAGDARHSFVKGDICDRALVGRLLAEHRPRAIVHFAAESHVDRSIEGPAPFIQTNVVGTFSLLEETVRWAPPIPRSRRTILTRRTVRMRRRRPPPTISCGPTITPTGCRC
jgi:dTDP-glucose 4,6-dehydratase